MKSWCDLSWNEKCKIEEGRINSFSYQSGYTFQVKNKVEEGVKNKIEKAEKLKG